jgi:hypothetical protein
VQLLNVNLGLYRYWQAKEINRVLFDSDPKGTDIDLQLMEHISPILSFHLLMLLDLQQAPHEYLRVTAYWPAYRYGLGSGHSNIL